MLQKILISIILLAGFVVQPYQTTASYYVSPNGSDSNPGTLVLPWKTIQKAASSATAGSTIYVRGGTYNEQVLFWYRTNAALITLTNYPGETVIVDGTGIAIEHGYGLIHIQRTDYIRVTGLTIQHSNGAGIEVLAANHIKIDGNHTYDTVKSGISTWYASDVLIDNNEIALACNPHPNYPSSEENISVASGSYSIEVSNNLVHKAANIPDGYSGGEGINIKDGSHDVKVHHNVVHLDERPDGKKSNRLAFGLDAWSQETYNISFYSNTAYNSGAGFVIESEAGGTARDIQVYNNTAYNNAGPGFYMPNWAQNETSLKKNVLFEDNLAYGNTIGIFFNSIKIENIVVRYNNFSGNGAAIRIGTGVPLAQITFQGNITDVTPTPTLTATPRPTAPFTATPRPTATPTMQCVWTPPFNDGTRILVCRP